MTDTNAVAANEGTGAKKRSGGLSSMLLADLKAMASGMGIKGSGSMKKAQLVEAIKAAQAGRAEAPASTEKKTDEKSESKPEPSSEKQDQKDEAGNQRGQRQQSKNQQNQKQDQKQQQDPKQDQKKSGQQKQDQKQDQKQQGQKQGQQQSQQGQQSQNKGDEHDDDGGSRRNRRRRRGDRSRQRNEPDTTILEDDILVPAAGILDVLDNYAFVRTTGYLPGSDDVYVSLSMVKKLSLRPGDAIVGQVRHPREGERKEKFNPMVRIDSVNGQEPESAKSRPEFESLTPVHPDERLRMETTADNVTGRVLDLAAPIGKGQRGLIVSPADSGKTTTLTSIAASLSTNHPECHTMVVLLDARPEEVTDFQRAVKGEVIASSFDHQPSDHTQVAELAIARAERLVELGHDVVLLVDGITRLGRAYNLAAQGSGRILSGGVDAGALHPPKKFFGAARNVENGGSLTMLATVAVETGSKTDELLFEEFQGTANSEIRLSRELAEDGQYPAIDVAASGTRRDDLLLTPEEAQIVSALRASLGSEEPAVAHQTLLERLHQTSSNAEFLMQVRQSTPVT